MLDIYYCNNCGHISFLNQSENELKPKLATSTIIECLVCKQETAYRKLVPEDLSATNTREFNQTVGSRSQLVCENLQNHLST